MSEIMNDRTVNIMLIAKRCGSIESIKHNIARYMSEECDCPIKVYDHHVLHSIVKEAFLDFYRSADKIHAVSAMRNFLELDGSDLDRMILSLGLAQVASIDDSGSVFYINGWHDTEFTEKIDKGEWLVSQDMMWSSILARNSEKTANMDFIESSRVLIRQDPLKCGVIELRKGVADISLGDRQYAQVRIRVGNARAYIRGMAVYSDVIPAGYDVVFYIGQEFGENGQIRGWGVDTNKEFKKPMTIIESDAEKAWDRWENGLPFKTKGATK